jgi:hypothetical protein
MSVTTQTAIDIQCDQCDEQVHLRGQLAQAIKSLVKAHVSHHTAQKIGDPAMSDLEANLDAADAVWKQARQYYLEHRKAHGC